MVPMVGEPRSLKPRTDNVTSMPMAKRKPLTASASKNGIKNGRCSRRMIFSVPIPANVAVLVNSSSRRVSTCDRYRLEGHAQSSTPIASNTNRIVEPSRNEGLERYRSRMTLRTPRNCCTVFSLSVAHARIEQRIEQVDQQGGGGNADDRKDGDPHDHVEVRLQDR